MSQEDYARFSGPTLSIARTEALRCPSAFLSPREASEQRIHKHSPLLLPLFTYAHPRVDTRRVW